MSVDPSCAPPGVAGEHQASVGHQQDGPAHRGTEAHLTGSLQSPAENTRASEATGFPCAALQILPVMMILLQFLGYKTRERISNDVFLPLCQIIVCFAVCFLHHAIMLLQSWCSRLCCWGFAGECSDGGSIHIAGAGGAR